MKVIDRARSSERPTPRQVTPSRAVPSDGTSMSSTAAPVLAVAVVLGLAVLGTFGGWHYVLATTLFASAAFVVLAVTSRAGTIELLHSRVDKADLAVIALTYVATIAFYRLAFTVIEGNDILLFLFFAMGMLIGVAGPVFYTVWMRRRGLGTLGLSKKDLPRVAMFAILFALVQFSVTFWGYEDWPGAKDVITLGVMALVVGIFESIFFRGFIQGRLEEAFGVVPAVFGSAVLYGAYHVGYGMGGEEIVFLSGLGVVYALAYATTHSVFVVWPLLTPLGSLYAQIDGGELVGRLPWAALMGWADVAALMLAVMWFARRHQRKPSSRLPI